MEDEMLYFCLNHIIVYPQLTFNGPLDEGLYKIFMENMIDPPNKERLVRNIRYERTKDPRIEKMEMHKSYLGETLRSIITYVENSFCVRFCANPTEDGGCIFYLEYRHKEVP